MLVKEGVTVATRSCSGVASGADVDSAGSVLQAVEMTSSDSIVIATAESRHLLDIVFFLVPWGSTRNPR